MDNKDEEAAGSARINLMLAVMGSTVFVLFCCVVVCARRCRSDEHDLNDELVYGYSIDMIDGRDLLLRENLVDTELEAGKSEWQCIVCIHMNHPDHDKCALCGASADATRLNTSLLGTALHATTLLTHTTISNSNSTMLLQSHDAAALLQSSNDVPLLLRSSSGAVVHAVDGVEPATTSRQRALRYRRLNDMQLTQKQRGASRRRLWQRVALPNGAFVWVRTAHTTTAHTNAIPPTTNRTLVQSDSLLDKLRNNTFLAKNPQATALHGAVAEQLHRKNAATMGFFTELDDDGAIAWRKTDDVIVQIDAAGSAAKTPLGMAVTGRKAPAAIEPADLDFEGLMSLSFRDKQRWLLKRVAATAVPYVEALHRISVRREHVLADSVVALGGYVAPRQLLQHVNISFVGEPALDAGGVLREWFGLVTQALFSAERSLFVPTHAENSGYWINPVVLPSQSLPVSGDDDDVSNVDVDTQHQQRLQYYTFAGRLVGKAILEGLVFETNLALPLLKHVLSVPITFSDLEFLDEELYRSAVWIRDHDDVDALCLTFSVQSASDAAVVELKPGGAAIDVTDANKTEYLALLLRYHMLGSVAEPLAAMLSGLYEIIPKSMLSVFDYQELDFFLSGLPTVNVTDWQQHSRVTHFAAESDVVGLEQEIRVVLWFWDAVEAFSDEERARLLQFATGSARVPVEGFKALTSASGYVHTFNLQLVPPGVPPLGLCPRAHTCFNRIDLPVYKTKDELVTYLTLVIQMEITGFGFE